MTLPARPLKPALRRKGDTTLLLGYAEESDIRALFELLGMVAKASGAVTREEIQEVERFIAHQIPSTDRELAVASFRKGKDISVMKGVITSRAFQLYAMHDDRWLEPIQVLDILLRVALADRIFTDSEEYIVDSVRATLGVHKRSYWILRDTLAERAGVRIARLGGSFAKELKPEDNQASEAPKPKRRTLTRSEALAFLELNEDADEQQIKIAHRALVKQFHPDLVEGKNLPDEEIKKAVQRFCEVQEAYEALLGS